MKRKPVKRLAKPHQDRKQNVSGRKRVESTSMRSSIGGMIDLTPDGDDDVDPTPSKPKTLRPIQQALENWKARQSNTPWWWLSFSLHGQFTHVSIVQGWSFLDGMNRAMQLGLVPYSADGVRHAVYAEELNDMAELGVDAVDCRLNKEQARLVFGQVVVMDDVELMKVKQDEVRFREAFEKLNKVEEN